MQDAIIIIAIIGLIAGAVVFAKSRSKGNRPPSGPAERDRP